MSKLLKEIKASGNIPEKVKTYNDANRKVAILCNHKRTVTAGHASQMEKLSERVWFIISFAAVIGLCWQIILNNRSRDFAIRNGVWSSRC